MFGTSAPAVPASDAAPRELLPDDDILALFKVDGDSASGALDSASEVIPEHDPLRMFEPGAAPAPIEAPAPAVNDDILGLFSAGESQPGELGAEVRAGEGRPARHVRGAAADRFPSARRRPRRRLPQEAGASEPDILDLFGVLPAKPEGKEAK